MGGKLNQLFTSFACSFGSLIMGMSNVWPSYTSSLYASESTPLSAPMSKAEDSLLGSLPSLGAMVGTAISGTLIDKLGRRKGGVALSLFAVISWAMIELSTSATVVLIARFLVGVSGGGFLVYGPIFISEVAEDSIRGALASAPILLYCFGTLISYGLGWKLSYQMIIWCQLLFSVVSTVLLIFVVESPVFWIRQKNEEEARASIARYRGLSASSMDVHDEVSKLKQQIMPAVELITVTTEPETKEEEAEKQKLNTENMTSEKQEKISTIKLLLIGHMDVKCPGCYKITMVFSHAQRVVVCAGCSTILCQPTGGRARLTEVMSSSSRRAFLTVLTVISLQVFMGMVPVQVYAKTVFTQTDPARSDFYTVLFALTMVAGSLVTTAVADKAGRRVLIISSSVLVCVCLSTLGYLLQTNTGPSWLIVFMILFYCFSFMFGAGAVPYILLAEVFVPEVQNLASIIIVEWVWFLNFFILALFPFLRSALGMAGVFYLFAAVALADAVISCLVLPETKGLSTQRIQDLFTKRK